MKLFARIAVALTVLVGMTAPAYAGPIAAIVVWAAAEIGVTVTAAAVTTAIVSTAIATGLSYLSKFLNSSGTQQSTLGQKTTLQSGGVVPRSFQIGSACIAGSEYYPARTWGLTADGKTPNAYFSRFVCLGDLPITALTGIIVDDQLGTYPSGAADPDLGYAIPEFIRDGKSYLWVKFFDGNQDAADAWAVSKFGADPDFPYSDDMVGFGEPYAIVTALVNPSLYSTFPAYKFVVDGIALYDPTQDSSVGGDGLQRWDTPSTWAYSDNAAVAKYNVLRGIPFGDQWFYGLQNSAAARLPLDSWFAAINVDALEVESAPGATAPQFRCGGEVTLTTAPADLLDELNKCDNGRIAEVGGIFLTRSGAVGAPVMYFNAGELIVTEAQTDNPFPGLEDTINGMTAQSPDPSMNWVMTDAPARLNPTLEAADGGRRLLASAQYNMVPFPNQVQMLMTAAVAEARKFRKHNVVAPPSAFPLSALDVIAWTDPERGYVNKQFTCVPLDQDNLDVGLAIVEVDNADYNWTPATDYKTYQAVPIISRPVPVQPMSGWAVEGETIEGDGGRAKPGIRFDFGTDGMDDIDGIVYEVRLAATEALKLAGETAHSIEQFQLGTYVASGGLSGDTEYEARGKYRPSSKTRDTEWSDWLPVTTPNVQIIGDEIADSTLTAIKFAETITPVQIVDDLADADVKEGATAVLTTTGELYRYHAGAWTKAVDAVDITNQLADAQIAALAASKITGTIINSQIAAGAITASNFASSIVAVEPLATLPVSGNFEGRLVYNTTDGQLYRYHSGAFTVSVPAANVGAGLTATQISSVAAATITGTLVTSQIGSGQITAGLIASATITATQLAAGSVGATQIAAAAVTAAKTSLAAIDSGTGNLTAGSVTASNIVAGTITGTQIASGAIVAANISAGAIGTTALAAGAVTASKITAGTITSTEIASGTIVAGNIASATITGSLIAGGTITATQLAANTITAGQIAAAAIGTTQLAAGAITASKMFIGSTDNLVLDGAVSDLSYWTFINITGATIVPGNGVSQTTNVIDFYTPAGNACYFRSSKVSCIPGDSFYFSAEVYQGTAGTVELDVEYYDAHGIGSGAASIASTTFVGVAILSGVVVVPSGVVYISIRPYWYASAAARRSEFSAPIIRRMYTGSLIVNGTITAANIAAATITAANIAGNTITASQIASGTITAAQIAASTITASKIAAATITSSELASNSVTAGKIAAGAINATAIIATNIIVTGHIQSNQITTPVVASAGNVTLGTSGWTTIATASITTNGGVVQCDFSSFASWTGGTAPQVTYRVLRDGATQVALMTAGGGSAVPLNLNMSGSSWLDSPGAGSHSYALQGITVSAAAVANANSIRIVELQR